MGAISAEDIISIIQSEIENFDVDNTSEETGTVIYVGDGIVTVYGIDHAMYGEVVVFDNGVKGMVQDIRQNEIGVILFGRDTGIKEGTKVVRTKKKAGIPVIAVDTLVYDQSLVDGIVVSDNYKAGAQCAKDLMKRKKKGKILFLVQSENKSAIDRIKGFKETLEKAGWNYEDIGDIECKGQLEVSQPLVENVLTKTKDIDAVVALNDPSAMGAMAALDAEHMLSDVLVYGADGSPEAKTMIYENKMAATSAQSPRTTGKKTVEMLYKILDGKKTEKQCIVPVSLITKDNINDYSLSGWQ